MSRYGGGDDYDYDDEPRRYRNVQTRPRGRDEPDYVREETYIERGKGAGPRDLVFRGREDSIEDIPRDFPPPGGRDREYRKSSYRSEYDDTRSKASRRTRSVGKSRYSDEYSDDDRSTYVKGGAGAAAGYTAGRRGGRDKRRRDRDYYSEDSESSRSRSRSRDRRKSGFEDVLGGLGLGGIAAALTGNKKSRSRSDSRDRSVRSGRSRSRAASRSSRRRRSSSGSSGRSRGGGKKDTEKKWAQAAQAALIAGAVEAFRSRKEAGPWTGDKGKRIATAAIGAGGIDGLLDRNPNEKTKRHLAEAVIGGLAANRLANGPVSSSRGRGREASISPDGRPRSRSRSIIDRFRGRSQSRGRSDAGSNGGGGGGDAIKKLAAGGALAAAGKAIYDRVRSKSRKRDSRSRSSSADSYVPSRNRRRDKRGSQAADTRSQGGGTARGQGPGSQRGTNGNGTRDLAVAGGAGAGAAALASRGGGGRGGGDNDGEGKEKKTGNEDDVSSSESTTDMEVKRKRMRGKELLTAGLASIATIHAAHGVYSSMEAHEKRHKLVAEGEMTPQEARKQQTKAWVQDAAAVGIAALGIKGAFSGWKEMNEQRGEIHEIEKRKREKTKRRAQREKQRARDKEERLMKLAEQNPTFAMMQLGQTPAGAQYNMPLPQTGAYPQQQGEGQQQGRGGGGGGNPQPDLSGVPYAHGAMNRYAPADRYAPRDDGGGDRY